MQKSSYEDSCVCADFFLNFCVHHSECGFISASEKLISLIAARRRPSTPRLHGIAEKNKTKIRKTFSSTQIFCFTILILHLYQNQTELFGTNA